MTSAPATHWLTKFDGDDGAWPYLVICSCPVGSDHDVLGTPMPSPDRQLAIARHHYGTESPAIEEAKVLGPELQDEVLKLVRLAVSDPGAFVPRGRERRDGETIYETIPAWEARAVLAAIERHPIVAIRPDRPTQWAYDQACAALEKHRKRAEQAEARLAELARLANDHSDPAGPIRTEADQLRPVDMQELHWRVADRIRETVRLSIGERAAATLNTGDVVILSGREADDAATAALQVVDQAALDAMANKLLDDFRIRAMDFRNGVTMDLQPARKQVAIWVGTARAMLGDAPNYTETRIDMPPADDDPKVSMEVKLAGELERYAFVLQRVGKLTPHEARMRAEAERDEARADLERVREQRDQARMAVRAAAQFADGEDPNEDRPTTVSAQRLAEILGEVDQYCPGCWRLHGTWCDPHGGTGYGATGRSST